MATTSDRALPHELNSHARIEASLDKLCQIIAPDWDPLSVDRLQTITDAVLNLRPATCTDSLEHRLERLCLAVEELGRWADTDAIIAHAISMADKYN